MHVSCAVPPSEIAPLYRAAADEAATRAAASASQRSKKRRRTTPSANTTNNDSTPATTTTESKGSDTKQSTAAASTSAIGQRTLAQQMNATVEDSFAPSATSATPTPAVAAARVEGMCVGINVVTRAMERGDAVLAIVCKSVKPSSLIAHIPMMSAVKQGNQHNMSPPLFVDQMLAMN